MTVQDGEILVGKAVLQIGIGLAIIAVGGGVAAALVSGRTVQEQSVPPPKVTPVEIHTVREGVSRARVETTGVVKPAREVTVVPQATGQVVTVSDQLLPGGRFAEGELIVRIDARDYLLAVEQERSRVKQADVELALERGRQETARREWTLLGHEGEAPALAARKPQLAAAELNLESARSGLARAELNLSRTAIRAPFNAMVISETIDIGQVVGASAIMNLVGTDRLWVDVSVPVEQLTGLEIPGVRGTSGSTARVVQTVGTERIEREGEVLRLAGELDARSRTATLIVAIDDPLNLVAGSDPGLPMLPGAFVDVVITGRPMTATVTVPRLVMQDDSFVWIAEEGRLVRRDVTVGWKNGESVVLVGGLEEGDQVITTTLPFPIEGMAVAPRERSSTAQHGE